MESVRYRIDGQRVQHISPTTFEAYLKNITDNTPEVRLVDSSVPANYANGAHWTTQLATALHTTEPVTDMSINMFRSNNGQACQGYAAFSYFMAAAWSTNQGQRILGAYEIERGSAGPPGGDGGPGGGPDAGAGPGADKGGNGCACTGGHPGVGTWISLFVTVVALRRSRRKTVAT